MRRGMILNALMAMCFVLVMAAVPAAAANTTDQILTRVDDILKANPPSPTDKVQMILFAQDDTTTAYVVRLVEGAQVPGHLHKTHDEIVYVLQGSGQMYVNGKWSDVKAGAVHFNPMNKAHSTKNTGKNELVLFSIFTPGMKEVDRQPVDLK